MLRVFKVQSPMSVGAWTLVTFSSSASAAVFADWLLEQSGGAVPVKIVRNAAGMFAAATGLVMATYTGVLIGVTTIPAWSQNVSTLPVHFGASAVASAVSLLELKGHRQQALNSLGMAASLLETAIGADLERRDDPALEPLKHGPSGMLTRIGGVLSGPVPFALRLLGFRSRKARRAAAVSSLIGSLITRYAWIEAGKKSAQDPAIPLQLEGR